MSENELGETQPNLADEIGSDSTQKTQATEPPADPPSPQEDTIEETQPTARPARRWRWVIGAAVGLIVFIGLGALGGMQVGISARQDKEKLDRAVEANIQFGLGEVDLEAGQCDIARQRFKYVIELSPTFPGAPEKLAEAMLCSGGTVTPTTQATAAFTPTPDLRGAEEIFSQTSSLLAAEDWDQLLLSLDTLRKNFPDYMPIEVDGMYYTALRNRGADRILIKGELESGIFDLNLAEQIGPLDAEADGYRQWAIWYIVGQSFWEVDWGQAVQYFSQIAPQAPNLHDANFFTAQDRLATAHASYAQDLVNLALFYAGAKGWCDADQLMRQADTYSSHSVELQPTAEWITLKCELNPNEQPKITPVQ